MADIPEVMPATEVMVQSMTLAAIPAISMLLGGLYPLVSSKPPGQKFSFALQHFAGKSQSVNAISDRVTASYLQRECC
jgi:hypothetical protein